MEPWMDALRNIVPICSFCHYHCSSCGQGDFCTKCGSGQKALLISSNPNLSECFARIRNRLFQKLWPDCNLSQDDDISDQEFFEQIRALGTDSVAPTTSQGVEKPKKKKEAKQRPSRSATEQSTQPPKESTTEPLNELPTGSAMEQLQELPAGSEMEQLQELPTGSAMEKLQEQPTGSGMEQLPERPKESAVEPVTKLVEQWLGMSAKEPEKENGEELPETHQPEQESLIMSPKEPVKKTAKKKKKKSTKKSKKGSGEELLNRSPEKPMQESVGVSPTQLFKDFSLRPTPSKSFSDIGGPSTRILTRRSYSLQRPSNSSSVTETDFKRSPSTDPNKLKRQNFKGENLLHSYCRRKDAEDIQKIISEGADVNHFDFNHWTPLHIAVERGKCTIIKVLLDNNALVNACGNANRTPLHCAVEQEYLSVTELLLKYGADPDAINSYGDTPRSLAASLSIKNELQALFHKYRNVVPVYNFASPPPPVIYLFTNKRRRGRDSELLLSVISAKDFVKCSNPVNATHVIVSDNFDTNTENWQVMLSTMLNATWLLPFGWLQKISETGVVPKEEEYEITCPWLPGLKKARECRLKLLPGLFSGLHFYFQRLPEEITILPGAKTAKLQLAELIRCMGGTEKRGLPDQKSLSLPKTVAYHAKDGPLQNCSHIILVENDYQGECINMPHIKTLTIDWLVKSIQSFSL